MALTRDEWLEEYQSLKKYMEDEGMTTDIGMPFTVMVRLLESAMHYMMRDKVGQKGDKNKRLPELKDKKFKRLRHTMEYLDWKDAQDEYRK